MIIYYLTKTKQEPFNWGGNKKKKKKKKKKKNFKKMISYSNSLKEEEEEEEEEEENTYIYEKHSNIPNTYNDEILEKTKKYYNTDKLIYEKVVTDDKLYKCMFNNNPKILNNKFVRTIIDPKYNYKYKIETTNCNDAVDPDKCNQNTEYNLEYSIFNETPNKYLDYNLDKNKIFLHHDASNNGIVKTFKDYDKVIFEDVQPIYANEYATCKPNATSFNKENEFSGNFPCGSIVCEKINDEEQDNRRRGRRRRNNSYNYDNLNNLSKDYHEKIMKFEHESAIDKVLNSLGFKNWISFLDQTQEQNTTLFNEPYPSFSFE